MVKTTRKEFMQLAGRFLTVSGIAAVIGPILAFFYPTDLEEMPSDPVSAGDASSLAAGEATLVRFGRYPAVIVHTPDGLRAYSAVCTHFACVVKWDPDLGQIVCPCHEGFFDPKDGSVISGPPPTPLEPLKVEIVDGQIFVGGPA